MADTDGRGGGVVKGLAREMVPHTSVFGEKLDPDFEWKMRLMIVTPVFEQIFQGLAAHRIYLWYGEDG